MAISSWFFSELFSISLIKDIYRTKANANGRNGKNQFRRYRLYKAG